MARLLDALMHPVSQIILLIGVIGLSIFFIFRPAQLPARPVAVPITPIVGGMLVPASTPAAAMPAWPPTHPPPGVEPGVAVADGTPEPTLSVGATASSPPLPTTITTPAAKPGVAARPLSAIPTLRSGPICACDGDSYSCRELGDQAQGCFDYCVARGQGDVHRLDFNQNGIACEE